MTIRKTQKCLLWTLPPLLVFVLIATIQPLFAESRAVATFAGGCFWCMEHVFDGVPGILSVQSGYTGGSVANPSYHQVSSGSTGHAEAVQVVYNTDHVSYAELLRLFWINIDPTTPHAQFCDHGDQYRPEIFVHDETQRRAAEISLHNLEQSKPFKEQIGVSITDVKTFYPAEENHQNYHSKNPIRYKFYRFNCGRDERLKTLWGSYDSHQLVKETGQ